MISDFMLSFGLTYYHTKITKSTAFTEISDPNKSNLCSATEELAIICSIWIALPLLVSKFEMTSCVVIYKSLLKVWLVDGREICSFICYQDRVGLNVLLYYVW